MRAATRSIFVALAACLLSPSLSTSAISQETSKSGLSLFQENCAACHIQNKQNPERLAPPVFAVKNHYLPTYRNRDAFINAIVRWVRTPNEAYSLMPGARMKFGLMPAIEMDEADIKKIAKFIYDSKFNIPGWYVQHYREEHGKDPEFAK